MARARLLKPTFWSSPSITRLSREARLFFVGMLNFADDYGVLLDSARRLLGDIFPYDEDICEKDISAWVDELLVASLICRVSFHNKNFIIIRNFHEHQKISHPSITRWLAPEIQEKLLLPADNSFINKDSGDTPECYQSVSGQNNNNNNKYKYNNDDKYTMLRATPSSSSNFENNISKEEVIEISLRKLKKSGQQKKSDIAFIKYLRKEHDNQTEDWKIYRQEAIEIKRRQIVQEKMISDFENEIRQEHEIAKEPHNKPVDLKKALSNAVNLGGT